MVIRVLPVGKAGWDWEDARSTVSGFLHSAYPWPALTEEPAPAICPCSGLLSHWDPHKRKIRILGLLPKSQRKVLEAALIFLTLRSELGICM